MRRAVSRKITTASSTLARASKLKEIAGSLA
jgi:hypothetical protein